MNLVDHIPVLPEVILLVGACAVMIADLYVKDKGRRTTVGIAQVILALCALTTLFVDKYTQHRLVLFNGLFVVDHMANLLKVVCYLSVSAALVYSRTYLEERKLLRGEFVSLLLFSLLGMMVLISANNFLTVR
jgi:NADH-quinone oxidoreductase subunit N